MSCGRKSVEYGSAAGLLARIRIIEAGIGGASRRPKPRRSFAALLDEPARPESDGSGDRHGGACAHAEIAPATARLRDRSLDLVRNNP